MKKRSLLIAAAFAVVATASAQAADISPVARAPDYFPAAANWTGFYVGVIVGGTWSNANWTDPGSGFADTVATSGFTGGGQVGFNYQIGQFVWGLEGDFSGAALSGSDTDAAGFAHATKTSWISTVTGRLGYAVSSMLFYAKGGAAFSDERDTVTTPAGLVFNGSTSTRVGWTAGGGAEYAIDHYWSALVEYDYLGLGSQSVSSPVAGVTPGSVNLNIQRVVVGLNRRF